jgi:hypothetical protein
MHGHMNIKHVTLCRGNLTYLNVLKEGSAFIFKDLPTLEGEGSVLFWDTGIHSINHDTTQDQNLQHQSHKNIKSYMIKVAFFFVIYFQICAHVLCTYIMGCANFGTGTCGTFNTGLSNIPTTQLTIPWTHTISLQQSIPLFH